MQLYIPNPGPISVLNQVAHVGQMDRASSGRTKWRDTASYTHLPGMSAHIVRNEITNIQDRIIFKDMSKYITPRLIWGTWNLDKSLKEDQVEFEEVVEEGEEVDEGMDLMNMAI